MKILLLSILQALFALLGQKTMSTDFTITVQQQKSQPISYTGSMTMHGEQFVLEAFGTQASYDGSTLFVYNIDANELTLSTPAREELYEANPLLFAQAMADACDVTEVTAQGLTTISLVPKDPKIGIDRITMKVKEVTNGKQKELQPVTIVLKEPGQTTTVKFTNLTYSDELRQYVLMPQGAFINDIR